RDHGGALGASLSPAREVGSRGRRARGRSHAHGRVEPDVGAVHAGVERRHGEVVGAAGVAVAVDHAGVVRHVHRELHAVGDARRYVGPLRLVARAQRLGQTAERLALGPAHTVARGPGGTAEGVGGLGRLHGLEAAASGRVAELILGAAGGQAGADAETDRLARVLRAVGRAHVLDEPAVLGAHVDGLAARVVGGVVGGTAGVARALGTGPGGLGPGLVRRDV